MEWDGRDARKMVRRYYRLWDEHAKNAMGNYTTGTPRRPNAGQAKIMGKIWGIQVGVENQAGRKW
jgi:hypothetical protein